MDDSQNIIDSEIQNISEESPVPAKRKGSWLKITAIVLVAVIVLGACAFFAEGFITSALIGGKTFYKKFSVSQDINKSNRMLEKLNLPDINSFDANLRLELGENNSFGVNADDAVPAAEVEYFVAMRKRHA